MAHRPGLAALAALLILAAPDGLLAQRSARVAVANETGRRLVYVTVLHKYSDNYKDQHTWRGVAPGTTGADLQVRYNTGFGTTGRDWWRVIWAYEGESRMHYTNPDNFRGIIDGMEQAGQIVVPIAAAALAAGAGVVTGPGAAVAAAAAATAGTMFAQAAMNDESTDGFKQHILRSDDANRTTTIHIRANGTVVFKSVSGDSETVSASSPVEARLSADAEAMQRQQQGGGAGQQTGNAGGQGAAAAPPPATSGFVRIQNRFRQDAWVNVEGGALAASPVEPGWWSADWIFQPVADAPGYVQLRNRYRTEDYIHIERGPVESGTIDPGWHSAQWKVEPVEGTPFVYLRNRWKSEVFLHTENGRLEAGPIQPGWWSAHWTLVR